MNALKSCQNYNSYYRFGMMTISGSVKSNLYIAGLFKINRCIHCIYLCPDKLHFICYNNYWL